MVRVESVVDPSEEKACVRIFENDKLVKTIEIDSKIVWEDTITSVGMDARTVLTLTEK